MCSPDGKRIALVAEPGQGGAPQTLLERHPRPWSLRVVEVASGAAKTAWASPNTRLGSRPRTQGGVNLAWGALSVTQRHLEAQQKHAAEGVLTPYLKVAKTNQRNMIKAGVRLLISTDAGIENPVTILEAPTVAADTVDPRVKLGESHVNAMIGLEELGMAPMELLKSATSNIAKAYKLDALIGTLEKGKLADVVILDANPLESARNYRRINMVIKDRKVVDLNSLPLAPIISTRTKSRT